MKFIVDLFKPKNEINALYAKVRKKIQKKEAAANKKRTAYLNRISRRVKWTAKKKELATIPAIKLMLRILKFFKPKTREVLFSKPDGLNMNFTPADINRIYSKAIKKRDADASVKRRKQKAYLDSISAKISKSNYKNK